MGLGRVAIAALLVVAPMGSIAAAGCDKACGQASGQATADETTAFREWATGPASYLLSEKEKRIADALVRAGATVTSENLAAFRHWFWERRDPSAGTLVNEFRNTYERRVTFVNKEFGDRYAETPGWRTPKGIAYLLLGPPTRIEKRQTRRHGAPEETAAEVWVYELDDAPVLRLPFIELAGRNVLATAQDDLSMRRRLDDALARAATDPIRNRDLPFTGVSPLTEPSGVIELPVRGAVSIGPGGIEAEISAPLSELYGLPNGDDLQIDLRLELRTAMTAAATPLGVVTLLVQPADFSRWHEREMRIAVWAPSDTCAGYGAELVVTEMVSGRTAHLSASSPIEAVSRVYRVEHLFGSAPLANGKGKAVAFLDRVATDEMGPGSASSTSLWVVRDSGSGADLVVEEANRRPARLTESGEDAHRPRRASSGETSCPQGRRPEPR